jgi:K+-sensing histidine kinase KdpD
MSDDLGFSIVKSIIQLHNGRCGLNNRPDGVEVWFEIPVKQKRKEKMRKNVRLRKTQRWLKD